MSAEVAVDPHGHHGHDAHVGAHATYAGYLTGFFASVVLTVIPFWLVMSGVISNPFVTGLTIMGFAAVQIVVHIVFFLHLDSRSENGWNLMALMFTLVLVVIALSGSLWVMHHLNTNMMPTQHNMQLP